MNEGLLRKIRRLWRADFLSPKDLLQRAAVLALLFLVAHLAGLREFTSILCGTVGSTEMSWRHSAELGVLYLILYMAFVLVVPVLVIAAAIVSAWRKYSAGPAGQQK